MAARFHPHHSGKAERGARPAQRGAFQLVLSEREFEIVAADVELPSTKEAPEKLLDATLSGVIARQGELATMDRDQAALACRTDSDCDDKRTCNGQERCAPRAAGADARGCVKGTPVVCPVNQVCGEGVGCRGLTGGPKPP